MTINYLKKITLILLFFYLPFQTMAWGVLGHRIVGEIAESYLSKKAKKEVYQILGTESIAMSGNWADFIKSDPAYGYLYNWHFINFNSGLSQEQFQRYLDSDTATDAYTKINFLTAELKKKDLDPENKRIYLRLLIHIVGDIHQPLHVGRLEDRGGNAVKILWFNDASNLHQIWDEKLINFQQLSYTEYATAINHTSKSLRKEWQQEPIGKWIYNSYLQAQKIYAGIKMPDQKLDYKYNFEYLEVLNFQLLQGGVHLAGLLNEIFG